MRLTDLDPGWLALEGRSGQGVDFKCPCGCGARLPTWFENPIDGGPPYLGVKNRWTRTGETFETLTLSPSIFPACWHGWVRNGEVTSV